MKDIITLHNDAMDLALQGDIAKSNSLEEESLKYYTLAFEKEREAALLANFMQNPEPGLSILFRSAASLAIQCGKYRESEQLIAKALSGNPPEEIAMELRDMLQDIYDTSGKSDSNVLIYKLKVPKSERKDFEAYLGKLGISISGMRRAVSSIAL